MSRLLHEDIKRSKQGGERDEADQAFMSSEKECNEQLVKNTSACKYNIKMDQCIADPSRIQDNNSNPRQRFQRANIVQDDYC